MNTALEDTLPDETAKVFLSYSRKDRERAQGIANALRSRNFSVFKDTDDILPTEEWRGRLEQLITEADTIVFLLSPHSAVSEVCAWEVELAHALNKRIAPIVIEDVEGAAIPPLLARLNFIFCTPRDPFEDAVDTLVSSLTMDIDWIREHTRITGLAARWSKAGRPNGLLLRGQDIRDAEAWRDARPREAPAVTPEQAALIAESRAAAGRRQRNIVIGAFASAVAAIGLAAFAYQQRLEADAQRMAAEENAAEVQRQRDRVARQLVSQSLRTGDFAGAAQTLAEIREDGVAARTVLAGLIAPEAAGKRERTGEPFLLNGQLHLSQQGAPPIPLSVSFSATGWMPLGESALLISDTSEVHRIDHSGAVISSIPSKETTRPCGVHRGREKLMLYSLEAVGYSAGSERLVVTFAPNEPGPFIRETHDSASKIRLDGPAGAFEIEAEDLLLACRNSTRQRAFGPPYVPTWADFERRIRPLDKVRFPGPEEEDRLWAGERTVDPSDGKALALLRPLGLTDEMARSLKLQSSKTSISGVGNIASVGGVTSFSKVSGGGTGGEASSHCLINSDRNLRCRSFHSYGKLGHALDAKRERLAIYGSKIGGRGGYYSLWIMDRDGGLTTPEGKERILSAAFGADGDLALLETGALIVLDAEGRERYRGPRPGKARGLTWLPDGRLVLIAEDGVHIGARPDALSFVALPPPAGLRPHPHSEPELWVAAEPDGQVIVLGYEDKVRLFDTGFMAPISGFFAVPHPGVRRGGALSRLPDAGWRLTVSQVPYDRRGFAGAVTDLNFDPKAPLE